MMFVRAYPRARQEMVFDAHDRAFSFFRGTCTRGIYDNMKTAVVDRSTCMPMLTGSLFARTGSSSASTRESSAAAKPPIDPWHYVPVLARKPGALRNGAPFKDWVLPPAMATIRRKLKGDDDGDRQMVQILSCVPDDGLQAVEAAYKEAFDQGVHSAPVVINILARSRDPAPAALLLTPATLRLTHEPVADCARYDSLRRTSRHGTHPNPRPDGDAEAL